MNKRNITSLKIRIAALEDLPALTKIYNQAIVARQTADTLPLTIDDRLAWFNAHQQERYPLFVACIQDEIVGYATLSQYRGGRPALQKVVEVSYYIHQQHQQKGIGSSLLKFLLEEAQQLGFKFAFALLLDINQASIRLLEKFDFEQWGHFPNVAEIDDVICGQYYYGKTLSEKD